MRWLPLIIVLPALCFLGAYGIQRRTRWAWYAGWVFSFFVAGGVAYYTMAMLLNAETTQQFVCGIIFTLGGAALWTFWAVWWSIHRDEFLRPHDRAA